MRLVIDNDHPEDDRRSMRPPGALPDPVYSETCTRCGDCVAVCPNGVLRLDAGAPPQMINAGICTDCGLCADTCMAGAIQLTYETSLGLQLVLRQERAGDAQ